MAEAKACLEALLAAAVRLERCLQEEAEALQGTDPARLEAAVAAKDALFGEIETTWSRLRQALAPAAHDDDWTRALEHDPHLRQPWQHLRERLNRCQIQNEINGRQIGHGLAATRRALEVLRGADGGAGSTYDARGRLGTPLERRRLGEG